MNKTILISFAVVLLVGAGAYFLFVPPKNPAVPPASSLDPRNATFILDGQSVTLRDGVSVVEAVPGSASKIVTRYFGNEARGDLNGDGKEDGAFLVTQATGGSGLFYYAVAVLRMDAEYKITNAFFVGDRIAPQSTEIVAGELHVNYAERKPDEPMTAEPSVGAAKLLKVTPDGALEERNSVSNT